jgi:hypothetical protein
LNGNIFERLYNLNLKKPSRVAWPIDGFGTSFLSSAIVRFILRMAPLKSTFASRKQKARAVKWPSIGPVYTKYIRYFVRYDCIRGVVTPPRFTGCRWSLYSGKHQPPCVSEREPSATVVDVKWKGREMENYNILMTRAEHTLFEHKESTSTARIYHGSPYTAADG